MRIPMLPLATFLLAPTLALAQPATPVNPAAPAPPQQANAASAVPSVAGLRQQLSTDLQKAGYSDVHLIPDSFLIQAKDKSGNPVTMFIRGNSVTEMVDVAAAAPGQADASSTAFTTVPVGDWMSSKIVGLDVRNGANQDIGAIKDVVYAGSSVKAYIVGVGGFLGMDEHYVAVKPSAMHITYNAAGKAWHATMNTTAAQLKAAPEFKYSAQG